MTRHPHPVEAFGRPGSRLAAAGVAALGAAVAGGWIVESHWLVMALPGWGVMQFNTALAFLLLGAGILAAPYAWRIAVACGSLVAVVGIATIASYLVGRDFGLDQLLVDAFTAQLTSQPGRMAPNTAFAFCLGGAALVILASPKSAVRLRPTAVSLALVSVLIGLFSLLAYAAGTPDATGWRAFSAMAPATALGFVLVGLLFARAGWHRGDSAVQAFFELAPSGGGLLMLLVSFNLWQALMAQSLTRLELETDQVLEKTQQLIVDRVSGQLNLMARIAKRWGTQTYPGNEWLWRDDVELLLAHFPSIDGIGLTDRDWVYRYAAYRGGPRPVAGTRADRDPLRRQTFAAAVERGEPRVTPALELIQGGNGFVIAAPTDRSARYPGLALAGVYFSDLLKPSVGSYPAGFAFSVSEGGREVYRAPGADGAGALARHLDYALPGATWRITVWPLQAHIERRIGALPLLVLLFGTATALLAWMALHTAQVGAAQNRRLSHVTHILESQVAERRRAEAEVRSLNAELEDRVKRRTAELEETVHELETFSYSVSHDLRAPLASISGFSRMLADAHAAELGPEGVHYLQRIGDNVSRMGQLIDDLLDLARVSRGELVVQDVNLTPIAHSVLARLREREPQRRVQAEVADGLHVRGDPGLLAIVIENLLTNAWKFTARQDPARIQVGAEARDGQRVIFVRDNGVGFDMNFAGKLFGVFQRLHSTSEFPGNGIGLATVRRIVVRHGGEAWAHSDPGGGAVFFFRVPD